jgi:phage gp16-like protein
MLAQIHRLKALQKLDDETYRDKLEQLTGKRSAALLSDTQLSLCLSAFHVKRSAHPHHAKIKALYIAAHNLGLVDGSDVALDTFVKRQTGIERLTFVAPGQAASVTEALKAILARAGFVVPANDPGGMEARKEMLRVQWKRLAELGVMRIAAIDALYEYVSRKYLTCHGTVNNLKRQDLDECARDFGRRIRRAQEKASNAA